MGSCCTVHVPCCPMAVCCTLVDARRSLCLRTLPHGLVFSPDSLAGLQLLAEETGSPVWGFSSPKGISKGSSLKASTNHISCLPSTSPIPAASQNPNAPDELWLLLVPAHLGVCPMSLCPCTGAHQCSPPRGWKEHGCPQKQAGTGFMPTLATFSSQVPRSPTPWHVFSSSPMAEECKGTEMGHRVIPRRGQQGEPPPSLV